MDRISFAGSNIFGIGETQELFDFYAKHKITADIYLIKADGVNEVFERSAKDDVKSRFVVDMKTQR
ncbi:hypothetical protein [Shewanella sp.]|uniref:hypothetical protein n=1 Tax=Shewanella sp. TaxID=50422 RepID=UPI003A974B3F